MNAVRQGVIISFFAAFFLLQSVSQLLPMHAFSSQQVPMQEIVSGPYSMSSRHSANTTEMNGTQDVMPTMTLSSHNMMTENCEIHCQSMPQDCAETMCTTLVYDAAIKKTLFNAPMQSVNYYSLSDYIGYSSTSLYRPPITHLS